MPGSWTLLTIVSRRNEREKGTRESVKIQLTGIFSAEMASLVVQTVRTGYTVSHEHFRKIADCGVPPSSSPGNEISGNMALWAVHIHLARRDYAMVDN